MITYQIGKMPGLARFFVFFAVILAGIILSFSNVMGEINPRMQLMARRAAKVDALRNLTEIIYGLRIDAQTTVRNFVIASDTIRTRLSVAIQGAKEIDYSMLPDGMAEVTVEITLGTVETILGQRIQYDQEIIEATGYGVPPGHTAGPAALSSSGNIVKATGNGFGPDDPGLLPAEKSLLGMRAAKIDAIRNLAEEVYQVRITSESIVRDFVVKSDDVRARVDAYVTGARVVSEKGLGDGRYQVEVEIDVEPLRSIVGVR